MAGCFGLKMMIKKLYQIFIASFLAKFGNLP